MTKEGNEYQQKNEKQFQIIIEHGSFQNKTGTKSIFNVNVNWIYKKYRHVSISKDIVFMPY